MDWIELRSRITAFLKKYKFVVIILLTGVLLMLLPSRDAEVHSQVTVEETPEKPDMQESLALILSKIDGAGMVEVLLTQAAGEQILYQSDTEESSSVDANDISSKTVIVTDSNRTEAAVIRQVIPPVYLGAVVVCQGGDSPAVKLAIVEAVSNATGLSADKISVLKMK